jgi:hypothetical protein
MLIGQLCGRHLHHDVGFAVRRLRGGHIRKKTTEDV